MMDERHEMLMSHILHIEGLLLGLINFASQNCQKTLNKAVTCYNVQVWTGYS